MKGKILGFALALLSVATVGVVQMQANAVVDSSRDCDKFAIVRCGTLSMGEIKNKFNDSDHAKVFAAFGIQKSEISGMKNGIVYQNGTVKVGGKTVATGAVMAARHLGGSSISGSSTAKRLSVSHMGSAQTALVKFDRNGRFMFAIMKPCGNPVTGHPTKPKPQPPKPSAICKSLSFAKLNDSTYRFYGKARVANGAKIKSYTFTIKKNGTVVNTKTIPETGLAQHYDYVQTVPGTYKVTLSVKTSVGVKTSSACATQFTVAPPAPKPSAVCKALTVTKIDRTNFRFNGESTTTNGATVSAYVFTIRNQSGAVVDTKTVSSTASTASVNYANTVAGNYTVKLVVKTSLGDRTSANCEKPFTVTPAQTTPTAICKALTVETIQATQFRFNASAEVTGSATVSGYVFTVYKGNDVVNTQTVSTADLAASVNYTQATAGDYRVKVVVKTSLGDRTSANCEKPFTVTPPQPETPGVKVEKFVENVKYKRVGVNIQYEYEIAVTNTGNTDLADVLVTDTPDQGITLISASAGAITNNTWTNAIPMLLKGETMNFTLQAKVPVFLAGLLTNTVCVDAPAVPGNPDDCDTADVDVPKPGQVVPPTPPVAPVTPVTPVAVVPTELPQTGASEVVMQLIGATSLAGAGSYYLTSRRNRA